MERSQEYFERSKRKEMIDTDRKLTRKEFLTLSALGLTGLASGVPLADMKITARKGKIALQLWTVRKLLEEDYGGTIKRIADIGYRAVETFPPPDGMTVEEVGRILKVNNLKVCSCHVEIDPKEWDNWLRLRDVFDCQNMVWHGWPEDARYKTVDGTNELIDLYHKALQFATDNELNFGLHNHWWELETRSDGKYPLEVLLSELDERIFFEIDTYWVKVGGKDPAEIVKKFGDRVKMMHIKDGPATFTEDLDDDNPEPMVAAGQGSQNFPAIVEAANGNTDWMIVELDRCATDMMTAVKESYRYLIDNGLAVV